MRVEYIDKNLNKIVRINPGDHILYHKKGNTLKCIFIEFNGHVYILDIKENIEINMPNVRWHIYLQKGEYIELDKQYYRDNKLNQLFNEEI